ncbi:hypothetical protein D3C81_1575810 [compost metagenome]
MELVDPLQHHVEGARRACGGQSVAVEHIALARDLAVSRYLGERCAVLRMYSALVAIQQSGLPQKPCAIPDPGQDDSLLVRCLQQVRQLGSGAQRRAQSTADHEQVELVQMLAMQCGARVNDQAQIAGDRLAVQAEGPRCKGTGPNQVGGDQGVERLREGRKRKMLEQEKTHSSMT